MTQQQVTIIHKSKEELKLLVNLILDTFNIADFNFDEGNLQEGRSPSFLFLCPTNMFGDIFLVAMQLPGAKVKREAL